MYLSILSQILINVNIGMWVAWWHIAIINVIEKCCFFTKCFQSFVTAIFNSSASTRKLYESAANQLQNIIIILEFMVDKLKLRLINNLMT